MNNKQRIVTIALCTACMLAGCTKINDSGNYGPTVFTGVISGHIMLYDQYGTKVNTGLYGIEVNLSKMAVTTTTDSSGYYFFTGVTTADYTITVHDPNTSLYTFGDNESVNFQYLADTLTRDIKLSAVPSFSPASMAAYLSTATQNDSLVFTITPDTRARDIIVFVNNSSTVNSQPANYLISYVKAVPANATTVTLLVPANDLHDQGISTGATAYYAAYGYPVSNSSVYEDITSGKSLYNALSAGVVTASATAP